MIGNITDDQFISSYKELAKEKQTLENTNKVLDVKIKSFNRYIPLI